MYNVSTYMYSNNFRLWTNDFFSLFAKYCSKFKSGSIFNYCLSKKDALKTCLFFKVGVLWEGHEKLRNHHFRFDVYYIQSNLRRRFHKIFWPSQNILTLSWVWRLDIYYLLIFTVVWGCSAKINQVCWSDCKQLCEHM